MNHLRNTLLVVTAAGALAVSSVACSDPAAVVPHRDGGTAVTDGGTVPTDGGVAPLPDGGGTPGTDGGPTGLAPAWPAAVVVPVDIIGADEIDYVTLFTVSEAGALVPTGLRLEVDGRTMQGVAVAPDGREAMVVYGTGRRGDQGVSVISVEPNGAGATEEREIPLAAGGDTPATMAYLAQDEVVVGFVGPDEHFLWTLGRQSDGSWMAGARQTIDDGPRRIYRLPFADSAVLFRSQVGDNVAAVLPLAPDGSRDWGVSGGGAAIANDPLDMAVHPNGQFAYVPMQDVATEPFQTDVPGQLLRFARAGDGAWAATGEPTVLPLGGNTVAVSADGSLAVVAHSDGELYRYRFVTMTLDAGGVPTVVADTHPTIPALLMGDMVFVGPYLLTAYTDDASDYRLVVLKADNLGEWQPVSAATLLDGRVDELGLMPRALLSPR